MHRWPFRSSGILPLVALTLLLVACGQATPADFDSGERAADGPLTVAPCLPGTACDPAILLPGNPAAWKLS